MLTFFHLFYYYYLFFFTFFFVEFFQIFTKIFQKNPIVVKNELFKKKMTFFWIFWISSDFLDFSDFEILCTFFCHFRSFFAVFGRFWCFFDVKGKFLLTFFFFRESGKKWPFLKKIVRKFQKLSKWQKMVKMPIFGNFCYIFEIFLQKNLNNPIFLTKEFNKS